MNFDSLSIGPRAARGDARDRDARAARPRGAGRGIMFIDLAVAQIAGLGVIAASGSASSARRRRRKSRRSPPRSPAALLLSWTDRRSGKVQEAIIGVHVRARRDGRGSCCSRTIRTAARSSGICSSGRSCGSTRHASCRPRWSLRSCSRAGGSCARALARTGSTCCSRSA